MSVATRKLYVAEPPQAYQILVIDCSAICGILFAPTLTSFAAPRGGPAHLGSGPAVV